MNESAARWPSLLVSTSPSRPLSVISIGSWMVLRLSAAHARDLGPAVQRPARGGCAPAAVRGPDDIRVKYRGKALEVALGDRLRERSHGAIVLVAGGREARALALDVVAGARGELPHRLGRAADHLGDVAVRSAGESCSSTVSSA
jgi:hypothetical protein